MAAQESRAIRNSESVQVPTLWIYTVSIILRDEFNAGVYTA